jgi:hypothetical protein
MYQPEDGATSTVIGNHPIVASVGSIDLSKLEATFVQRLEKARRLGRSSRAIEPVVLLAEVPPSSVMEASSSGFGVMAGTVREIGDTVVPLEETDWEALR